MPFSRSNPLSDRESKSQSMEVSIRRKDEVGIVELSGKVMRDDQETLRDTLLQLAEEGLSGIALDFSAVEYIDSAGLGACASGRKLLREKNGAGLVMFGASPSVARMWKLIRLDIVVPSFATEDAAMICLGALELEPGA